MGRFLESPHLRVVAEVARAESVTRAADRLNVTQSAVSHQLRDLEDKLGTPLFVRSGRRMLPTAAGRVIASAADEVLSAIGRVEAQVEQLARHASGELRVCTHCYTGYSWLPSLVAELRRRYPGFALQIAPEYTLDPVAALLDAKLDLAITNDAVDDRRLRHRELFDDEHVAVVPASHPWTARPFVTPEEIAGESLYLYSRSIENSFIMRNVLRPLGLVAAHATYLQLPEGILEMVKAGMGATVLPRWSIASALAPGDIRAVRITRNGVFRKWYAVTLADVAPTPFMEAFVALLMEQGPASRRPARRRSGLAS
jgi:LysR family transcriptional regulator, regulator for metE and metH